MSNESKSWATILLGSVGSFLDSINAGVIGQTRFKLIPTEHLNRSTLAGVIDMTVRTVNGKAGAPIIRFDMPHRGADFPHINIDPNGFPHRANPHIRVPQGLIECASKIDKCLKFADKALFIIAIVTDGCRILGAIYEDQNDKEHTLPHKTIKTIAEIAGSWSLGLAGSSAGSLIGAKLGACIGGVFGGPVGALIGAPIGAVIGGLAGGISGGLLGSYLAGNFAEALSTGIEVADWQIAFQPIAYIICNPAVIMAQASICNPAVIMTQIATDIKSDDPKKQDRGKRGQQGAAIGSVIGSTMMPVVGSAIGSRVGATVGWVSGWLRNSFI